MNTPTDTSSPRSGWDGSANLAANVCRACRARKRKCDRALPTCSFCSKRKVKCQYDLTQTPKWPYSPSVSQDEEVGNNDGHGAPPTYSLDYPTASFLDPSLLRHGQLDLPQATHTVPVHLLGLLGDADDLASTIDRYLEHVHTWLPFLSRNRLKTLASSPLQHLPADVVLLCLAIKLIITPPPHTSPRNPRTALYHTIKHFHLDVENSGAFSITVLQAGVLVSLYEIAHAIYPAAYLSIAACARYGNALGLGQAKGGLSRMVTTLVEMEERRRAWWAVVVLDRFVCIGCPGRPVATLEPGLDEVLPTDNWAWDERIVCPDSQSTIANPTTGHMGKFALICQAARLLGQVLQAVSSSPDDCNDSWLQLDRTLQFLLTASLSVDNPDFDQITFIYSALTALHTPTATTKGDSQRSRRSQQHMQQLTDRIKANLLEAKCLSDRDPEDMPPWGLFFAYRVCVATIDDPNSRDVLKVLTESLRRIETRWCAAGVYLRLLEAQEVMLRS